MNCWQDPPNPRRMPAGSRISRPAQSPDSPCTALSRNRERPTSPRTQPGWSAEPPEFPFYRIAELGTSKVASIAIGSPFPIPETEDTNLPASENIVPHLRAIPIHSDTVFSSDAEALDRLDEELSFRGYADATRYTYDYHVRQFLDAVDSGIAESNEGIRTHMIQCLDERGYSLSYAHQAICALKFFYRYIRPDVISLSRIPTFRREQTLPKILSRAQIASLFEHVDKPRNRALLMLVYSSGVRVSELVRLKPSDFDRERRILHVPKSKTRADRFTIFSEIALTAVEKHWPHDPSDPWVFAGKNPEAHISRRTAQRAFQVARDAAGMHLKGTGVHTLRHSFATHLLEQGTPLVYLQKLLGHKSPKSTLVYLHLTQAELTRIRNPLDELVEGPTRPASDAGRLQDESARSVSGLALYEPEPK